MSDYLVQLQKNLDGLTKRVDSLIKPETASAADYTKVAALYQSLPALRYLGLGGLGSSGEWRDLSGNGMHLSYNGNPVMGYTSKGAPWWAYDGAGDYHSHADDAHFDITGTETTVNAAARGMTICLWARFSNAASATEDIFNKYLTAGDQRSYRLLRTATGEISLLISSLGTGASTVTATTTATVGANTWTFIAARFVPSAAMDIWTNDTKYSLAAGVPASIFSGTALVYLASLAGSNYVTGYLSFPVVSACVLADTTIGQLYQSSRGLFGV